MALAVAGLIVATVLVGSLVPASHGGASRVSPAEDTTCAEWTDGCTICQRHPEGAACSMPGIACVRETPHCLRHAGG